MGERIRDESPEMTPEAAASPERDPALRGGAQNFLGRAAVQGPSREAREAEVAPKLGRAALAGARREETREAAARRLGRQAVEREAHRSRD